MAVPSYQAIYDQVNSGSFWQRVAIAVSQAQKAKLALAVPTPAEIAWANRDAADEARRIVLFVIGTAPIVSKLDAPGTITDADIDAALTTLLPNLLKAVV
jgi:hypothetical protein